MPSFDMNSRTTGALAIAETTSTTAGDTNGASVDCLAHEGVTFYVHLGTLAAGGTGSIKVQQSPDDTVWTDVPAPEALTGDNAAATIAIADTDDDTTVSIGSVGKERYQRVVVTRDSVNSMVFSATSVLSHPRNAP